MNILKVEGLKKYYGKEPNIIKAVDDINFTVEKGRFISIVGSSGSGKSTLLHLIGGLDKPTSGRIFVEDNDITSMEKEDLTIFRRRKIGFVFQAYNLVPVLNVWENITLPMGFDGRSANEDEIKELMEDLNIYDKKQALPSELSGGQQQRVAIARALAIKPSIILADEPTGNLDSKNRDEVMRLLKKSVEKHNQTIIMITHDDKNALVSDEIITIEDGQIVKYGGSKKNE